MHPVARLIPTKPEKYSLVKMTPFFSQSGVMSSNNTLMECEASSLREAIDLLREKSGIPLDDYGYHSEAEPHINTPYNHYHISYTVAEQMVL